MDGVIAIGIAGVLGLISDSGIAKLLVKEELPATAASSPKVEWWNVREMLTATQLQILLYLEYSVTLENDKTVIMSSG